jgi:Rps23 Pro-64 3,4-dihydroxylase Tpa1-like proline 4-hydroxylase
MFNQNELKQIATVCCQKISIALETNNFDEKPFKHLVIDDFFPDELANICLKNFPSTDESGWDYTNDSDIEVKYRTTWESEFDIPDGLVDAVRIMNSSIFLKAMASTFSIQKIIPDPYFTGGGLNITKSNGLLDVHVDGNYHDATGLTRRLNAILYLNPNWKQGWGGEFGLYDENGDMCLKKVAPLFNRLVIFDSHDKSFHGLPNPLNFPDTEERKSIILYYYTKEERPSNLVVTEQPHSALWKKRDLLDKRGNKVRESF